MERENYYSHSGSEHSMKSYTDEDLLEHIPDFIRHATSKELADLYREIYESVKARVDEQYRDK